MIKELYSIKETVDPVMFEYLNANDMQLRLRDSTLRYQNSVIRIETINPDMSIKCIRLENGRTETIPYEAAKTNLSLKNLKLGYCNSPNDVQTYYLKRSPVRQGDQGIQLNNCSAYKNDKILGRCLDFVTYQNLNNMFNNNYPSIISAKKIIETYIEENDKDYSLAFSKEFALCYLSDYEKFGLSYKGFHVGAINTETKKFSLLRKWRFLKETFESKHKEFSYATS